MAGRPIDEKIVVMKLDNSDFKQKAMETTGLFGKLKDSLNKIPGVNLGKTVQDLNGIKSAASNTNLGPLSTAVQGVGNQFSAMSVVATTALATIVNKAVNAGTALGKALSLDQVTAGFQEYELKMGSIQTILANTAKHGTTLEDVTRNFEELNAYADKTIYNFGDMTRNIGLFTNAGLKIDESTSMIKGFSNMAAASGTNSEKAAGAAYQLSQGLSSGYIMTMDWMSLTNAGMGNDNMKNDLIALGQEMGTLDKTTEHTMKNWKDVLSDDKWLTTDVMSTYLQTMAGDIEKAELLTLGLSEAQADLMLNNAKMGEDAATKVRTFTQLMDTLKEGIGSGWAVSFETVLGDFNEATELFSGISDKLGVVIEKNSKTRNEFLKGVAKGDGFTNIFDGIISAATPVAQVFGAMSAGFKKVFPPASVATVVKLTEKFKEFAAGLALSKDRIAQVTTIFQGVFSIFSSVWEIAKRLTSAFLKLIPDNAGGGILKLAETLSKLAIGFNTSLKEGNMLTGLIDGLGTVFGLLGSVLGGTGEKVIEFAGSLRENLGKAIDWIKEKLAPVGEYFKEAFGGSYGDEALGAGTLVAIFAIVKKIKEYFEGDFDIFGSLGDMVDGISDTFSGIGEAVNNFATSIKYVNLILIATAIGILAASLKILEGIKAEDISKGITALASTLGLMIAGMLIMSKFNVTGGLGAAVTLIGLAVAVNIMAVALKKISDLDTKELVKGISGLAAIVATLSIALIAISKFGGKMQVGSLQLIALAGAIVILASAVETMSEINTKDLFKSIGALALIFGSLAIFLKIVDRTKFGMGSAVGLVLVAAAVKVMVSAIEDMADIDNKNMVKGLISIAAILGALALFSKVAGGPQMLIAGAGMLVIAEALKRLVEPITAFSEMSWQELGKGMAGLAASLLILAGGIALITLAAGGPMLILTAAGLLIMAKAIEMLIPPIETLSKMTWEELAKGMAGMAAALLILAGAAALMTIGIAGALGVVAMAYALQLLIPPIEFFSKLSWMEMLKGFTGLALAFAILAGAALLLTPAVPSMLAFGLALGLIGIGMLAAGAGMMLFGTGMTALATLTTVSVTAIVTSLGLLIQGLGGLILNLVDFLVDLGMALLDGLNQLLPKLAEVAWNIVQTILTGLETNMPMIVEKGSNILISLIDGMATKLPEIMASITNLMEQLAVAVETNSGPFLNAWLSIMTEVAVVMVRSGAAVIDALFGWIPGVGEVTSQIGDTAELNIREAFDAQKVATDKGTEFANSLSGTSLAAGLAGNTVGVATSSAIMANSLSPIGNKMGLDFSGALGNTSGSANAAGTTVGANARSGADTANLTPIGSKHGTLFANGLLGTAGQARNSGIGIGNSAEGGANTTNLNPAGSSAGAEFASSVASKAGNARTSGVTLGNNAESGAGTANLNPIGSKHGSLFASGLVSKAGAARTSGVGIANSGKGGAGSVSMGSTGTNFGNGFAGGINAGSVLSKVTAAGMAIARAAKRSVEGWLDINSPSRVMIETGGHFGDGFAIGIKDKAKKVGDNAKVLAVTAKDSLNRFIEGFDPSPEDNEIHFKAVVDYDGFNPGVGNLSVGMIPDTRMTSGLATSTYMSKRQNANIFPEKKDDDERVRMLLSEIKENTGKEDPDRPIYLVVNDKVVGQSISKQVAETHDLKYMKAERGLANA